MPLSSGALVLLALIAVASIVQTVCLAMLAWNGLRTKTEIERLGRQITRDIQPLVEDLTRISRNAAEISDRGLTQARRLDDAVGDAARTIEQIVSTTHQVVLPAATRLAAIVAGFRMFRSGRRLFRRLFR
jgi:predicted PurR-regulated permease PerM